MKNNLYEYLLMLGDNSMILGHRLSELCGHGPSLETDIALTNISLDLFGQVRSYFQYAAEITGGDATEDSVAFLREEFQYRNVVLVEQENKDFAYVIIRQFLFDAYYLPVLEFLVDSKDEKIAFIAQKCIKELRYHYRFSSEWVKRLGDGTDESHRKLQDAVNYLYPYSSEFFRMNDIEEDMMIKGIGPDMADIRKKFNYNVVSVFAEAGMSMPETPRIYDNGKNGVHSEHLGYILSQLQYMQRAYPNMTW